MLCLVVFQLVHLEESKELSMRIIRDFTTRYDNDSIKSIKESKRDVPAIIATAWTSGNQREIIYQQRNWRPRFKSPNERRELEKKTTVPNLDTVNDILLRI